MRALARVWSLCGGQAPTNCRSRRIRDSQMEVVEKIRRTLRRSPGSKTGEATFRRFHSSLGHLRNGPRGTCWPMALSRQGGRSLWVLFSTVLFQRWATGAWDGIDTLRKYLSALFKARPGRYRVIAFVVTARAVGSGSEEPDP